MTILLKPQHEEFIQSQLTTGQFRDPDEVIEMAFRLLEKSNIDDAEWMKSVREKVTIARAEIAGGKALDGPTVVNQILDRPKQNYLITRHVRSTLLNLPG